MLHLLITNSINEIYNVLLLHTNFLPSIEDLRDPDKPHTIERTTEAPQVRIYV